MSAPLPRLDRALAGVGAAAPVRVLHVGPGAFFRAHQAWYTGHASREWGIAAVTGRSNTAVETLGPQGGCYTLLTRGPERDEAEAVGSISEVVAYGDPRAADLLAAPSLTVVTLTVTEAGYQAGAPVLTRLLQGLDRRRQAGAGPHSLVACDNLAGNGTVLRSAVLSGAPPELRAWIEDSCSFPSTVVDRITPATTEEDRAVVADLMGWEDRAVAVTEPASEWIIEDRFPAARPPWELAGARFVDDVAPFEQRKLRILNAGHSLLAYRGLAAGLRFVHEAFGDGVLHQAVVDLWRETRRWMMPAALDGVDEYCATVETRWTNPRLPHALAQIAMDGSLKLRQRLVPTIREAREQGAEPVAGAGLLGAWV
ncbi:MAG: mannitol dehydrogenase family protein, partial [Candidatus Dormibacteraeota bacterium]|nr:mannitol dehydrogenase family protein [Candidatus Dormibacteraeota bacterium]